jgi:hypothetical protein
MLLRQRRANTLLSKTTHEDTDRPFGLTLADVAPTPEQTVAANELRATLLQAISELRKNLRTVVLLPEFQGLTIEETAQRLGLTVAAVLKHGIFMQDAGSGGDWNENLGRRSEVTIPPLRRFPLNVPDGISCSDSAVTCATEPQQSTPAALKLPGTSAGTECLCTIIGSQGDANDPGSKEARCESR